jgi:hypothetical protein
MTRRVITAREQHEMLSPWRQAARTGSWFHPEIGIEEYPTLTRKQQKSIYDEILSQGGPKVLSNVYHPDNWGSGDPTCYHHYIARGRDGTIHGVLTAMRDYKTMEPKRQTPYRNLGVHDVYTGDDAPKGTGTALMQAAAHRAMRDGVDFKVWGVVPRARGFYHNLGGTCEPNFAHFEWTPEDRDALAMGTPNKKPVTPMTCTWVGNPNPPFGNDMVDPVMPPGVHDEVEFGEKFVPEELRHRQTTAARDPNQLMGININDKGSGTSVEDVNKLLKQFIEMRKMMKQLMKMGPGALGGLFGGQGMGGLGGMFGKR